MSADAPSAKRGKARTSIHADFARRLQDACDINPEIPNLHHGRNTALAGMMRNKYGVEVKTETVRKWFAGEIMPRPNNAVPLAGVLGVDLNWLLYGIGGQRPVSRTAVPPIGMAPRPIEAELPPPDIAMHLAIGIVQVGGGRVTEIPKGGPVQFRAEIKGITYAFHAVLGVQHDRGWQFVVPPDVENTFILGIVAVGPARFRMVELDWEAVQDLGDETSAGKRVWIGSDLKTGSHEWREITTFARRL